jgi:hypothetical protein
MYILVFWVMLFRFLGLKFFNSSLNLSMCAICNFMSNELQHYVKTLFMKNPLMNFSPFSSSTLDRHILYHISLSNIFNILKLLTVLRNRDILIYQLIYTVN